MLIFFLWRLQQPGLSVPLFFLPGEMKLLRKKGWVLSAVKAAPQAMRCWLARAWIVRHLRVSFGKRGVWADVINAKRICHGAVVLIEQKTRMMGSDAPGPRGLCRLPGAWRLPKWQVVNDLSRKLCRVCGIAGQSVSVFLIECVSKREIPSSAVLCSPVFLMFRLSGVPCSRRWSWSNLM